jgi:hypothetical protein
MKSLWSYGKIPTSFLLATSLLLVLILVLAFVVLKNRSDGPVLQDFLGNMARKADLLAKIRVNLHMSAEAEKSAVMADTDKASQDFAERSRQAADFVERDRREFETLVTQDHTTQEMKLFGEFTSCWEELRRIDDIILQFAVQNTNLKAAALSFTEGRKAMDRFERSLRELIHQSASSDRCSLLAPLAADALAAGLKMHNLQAPHIVEPTDLRMDELEAEMRQATDVINASLGKLTPSTSEKDRALIEEAKAAFAEFSAVNTKVVSLSRQNTNVKSFELSLGNKRKIAAQCDETLVSLQEAVRSRVFKATR